MKKKIKKIKSKWNPKKFRKRIFISITNDIVFICGYGMLALNLQLLLIIAIIGNICMLPIQKVLGLGTPNHYKHGVNLRLTRAL
jgi:hypothetical protein